MAVPNSKTFDLVLQSDKFCETDQKLPCTIVAFEGKGLNVLGYYETLDSIHPEIGQLNSR